MSIFMTSDPLAGAERLAKEFIAKWPPGTEVLPSAFAEGSEPVAGETTEFTRRYVLRTLGVIDVAVGRGGPATTALDAREIYPQILHVAREIWKHLEANGQVSQKDIASMAMDGALREDDVRRPGDLLKQLGLAIGIRRAGGLRLASAAQREVKEQLAQVPQPFKTEEALLEKKSEAAYYELFATLVDSWESYEAAIVGKQQIGRGEWSTPDIVAISVEAAKSLIIPIVRIITVEVKLILSRLAIAEASSHKRFAHYAYVGVPQAPADMDPLIVSELAAAGLGLICPRRADSLTFHVYLEPQLNRPDEDDIEQLLQRFNTNDGQEMSKETRERVRKSLLDSLGL